MRLFRSDQDYAAFQRCLIDTLAIIPIRLLGYVIMPNHWHLALWPERDGDLARFMLRLTITHVRRWVEFRHVVGEGHVYQGRYKSFACQSDDHVWTMLRYLERNALRAKLVRRAEDWRWSSLGQLALPSELQVPLYSPPSARRDDWIEWVNQPQTGSRAGGSRALDSRRSTIRQRTLVRANDVETRLARSETSGAPEEA